MSAGIFGLVLSTLGLYITYRIIKPVIKTIINAVFNPIYPYKTFSPKDGEYPDDKAVDNVLKKAFKIERVPQNLDAIVIGSGPAGLSTAHCLARSGKRVLVLEQHDMVGGSMHTFTEHGYEFDTGHHFVLRMEEDDILGVFLQLLAGGKVEFRKIDKTTDQVTIGYSKTDKKGPRKYCLSPGDVDHWVKELTRLFPSEENYFKKLAKNVRWGLVLIAPLLLVKFLPLWLAKMLTKVGFFEHMTSYPKETRVSVTKKFEELRQRNPDLAMLFNSHSIDFVTSPSDMPFSIWSLVEYAYSQGIYYPRGGTTRLNYYCAKNARDAGAEILVRADVKKILFQNNRAVGVTVQKGSSSYDIYAPIVVSAAGIDVTFNHLLPKEILDSCTWYNQCKSFIKQPTALFQLFVGLKGDPEELGLPDHCTRGFATADELGQVFKDYLSLSLEEALEVDIPWILVGPSSSKDPTYKDRHPGKSAMEIFCMTNNDWFRPWQDKPLKKRGDDYEALQKAFGQKLLDQTLELCPEMKDNIDCLVYGTSASANNYLGRTAGGASRLDCTVERCSLEAAACMRADSGIPGLYLSGEDTLFGGVQIAAITGAITASEILDRNIVAEVFVMKAWEVVTRKLMKIFKA